MFVFKGIRCKNFLAASTFGPDPFHIEVNIRSFRCTVNALLLFRQQDRIYCMSLSALR